MSNKQPKLTGWAGGLNELEEHQTLPHPPQRAFRTNDGSCATPVTVFEDQTLVGYVLAPQSARESFDLYGIDMSYATFDQLKRRWTGCFFSEQVADMLVELTGEDTFRHGRGPTSSFPYPFEARPSWAELDWKVRQARGETRRPEYAVYLYCEPASEEALDAWKTKTGEDLVRRGTGGDPSEEVTDPGRPTAWITVRKGKKQ